MSIPKDFLLSSFRSVLDAPGMRVTPADRKVGMMPNHNVTDNTRFTAHSTGEAQSDFQKNIVRSAKDVFAGTCGGITVTLLGHPFDTVKMTKPSPRGSEWWKT